MNNQITNDTPLAMLTVGQLLQVLDEHGKRATDYDTDQFQDQILDEPVEAFRFSARLRNVLRRNSCETLRDVLANTPLDIKQMHNMGPVSFMELTNFLSLHGLKLKDYDE